jgi:hypothetical protein
MEWSGRLADDLPRLAPRAAGLGLPGRSPHSCLAIADFALGLTRVHEADLSTDRNRTKANRLTSNHFEAEAKGCVKSSTSDIKLPRGRAGLAHDPDLFRIREILSRVQHQLAQGR